MSIDVMSTETIGEKLRHIREEKELPLRKVAALLDIDVAILSKMERGERKITKEVVLKLADIYDYNGDELLVSFLSDKILYEIQDEDLVIEALKVAYPKENIELLKVDTIGPKVGQELRTKALIAVILAVLAIMIYIAFRFEFTYGIGAAIAIVHDVLVTLAIVTVTSKLGILNLEINQSMIAAFLTVVGFSVNDTVIIFDRIRENLERHKGMNLIKLINLSINETLSRTINTVLTVVLVLTIITIFGGEVLQGFSFTMLVGIVTGTYSSIYIASAFVIWYLQKVKKVDVEGDYDRQNKAELAKAAKA